MSERVDLMKKRCAWLALAVILALTATARWRVLDVPLERDEGEYAYMAQLLLRGIPPYAEACNMKLPGIYAAYAGVLAVFGETARGIHQGLLVVNAATIVLVFLLARQLFDPGAAVAAAAGFAVLSVSSAVRGIFANAEHFILPFALGGLLLVQAGLERDAPGRLALGGVLLGCGLVVKQHGFVFLVAGGLLVLGHHAFERPIRPPIALRRTAIFGAAALVPYGLTCIVMWIAGVFPSFWLWTFHYARAYLNRISFSDSSVKLRGVCGEIFDTAPILCAVAGVGLASLAWDPVARRRSRFVLAFTVLSVVSVFPGYLFRAHYFQLAMPALALLFGLGTVALGRLLARSGIPALGFAGGLGLAVGAVAQSVVLQSGPLFRDTPVEIALKTVGTPFHVSREIAERLRRDTDPADRIGILGSEPQIYFYSGRRAATRYLYTYALMENQPFAPFMLAEFEREIESHAPRYLVWVNLPGSWLPTPDPYRRVVEWFERVRGGYDLVARYDVGVPTLRVLEAADLAAVAPPRYSIDLYRRRSR